MFTSRLEIAPNLPVGHSMIRLQTPKGSGDFEFLISRVGSTESVLGPDGWQPSESWFQISSNIVPDAEGMILVSVGPEIIQHLSLSNYTLTVRIKGGVDIERGILVGGAARGRTKQDAALSISDHGTATPGQFRSHERESSSGLNTENEQLNVVSYEIPVASTPNLDDLLAQPIESIITSGNATSVPPGIEVAAPKSESAQENLVYHNNSGVTTPGAETLIAKSTGPLQSSEIINNITAPIPDTNEEQTSIIIKQNSPVSSTLRSNKTLIWLICGTLLLALIGWLYFGKKSVPTQAMPNSQQHATPEAASGGSIPEPSMQEANRLVNSGSDVEQLYKVGMAWRSAGHSPEAFLVLEAAGTRGDGRAAAAVGEMFDPYLRKQTSYSFPIPDALKAANWYSDATRNNSDVQTKVNGLRQYLLSSADIDTKTKTEALAKLSSLPASKP